MPGRWDLGRPWNGVVVGFDGTDEGRCAVRWAAERAERHDCPLYVVRVLEPIPVATTGWAPIDVRCDDRQRTYLERQLLDEVEVCRTEFPGVEVYSSLHEGRASARLAEYARHVDAGLIAVGAPRQATLTRLMFGSTVDELVRTADRTVVVVRDVTPLQQASLLIGRSSVVVGIDDLGEPAASALDFAFDVAAHDDSAVTVVHAAADHHSDVPVPAGHRGSVTPSAALQLLVRPRCHRFPGVTVTTGAVTGRPEQALLEHSEEARLLVVAKPRLGTIRRLLSGSISGKTLRHAACSVAVVGSPAR